MLAYQPLVRRRNGDTSASGPMAVPRIHHKWLGVLLLALVGELWAVHCFDTAPGIQVAHTTPVPMGYPGSTTTDWAEGTYSDKLPELRIGFTNWRKYKK